MRRFFAATRKTPPQMPNTASNGTDSLPNAQTAHVFAKDSPLLAKIHSQFDSKLKHRGSAERAYSDFSLNLDHIIDKVNLSISSTQRIHSPVASPALANLLKRPIAVVESPGFNGRHFTMLAESFAMQGNLPKLRVLVRRIKTEFAIYPHADVSNALLRTCLLNRDYAAAEKVFDELRRDERIRRGLRQAPGCELHVHPDNDPCKNSRYMIENAECVINANVYYTMMCSYFQHEDLRYLIPELYNEMVEWDISVSASVYSLVLQAHLHSFEYTKIKTVFESLKKQSMTVPEAELIKCYSIGITALFQTNDFDAIVELYESLEISGRFVRDRLIAGNCILAIKILAGLSKSENDVHFGKILEVFEECVHRLVLKKNSSMGKLGSKFESAVASLFHIVISRHLLNVTQANFEKRLDDAVKIFRLMGDTTLGLIVTPRPGTCWNLLNAISRFLLELSKKQPQQQSLRPHRVWIDLLKEVIDLVGPLREGVYFAADRSLRSQAISALIEFREIGPALNHLEQLIEKDGLQVKYFPLLNQIVGHEQVLSQEQMQQLSNLITMDLCTTEQGLRVLAGAILKYATLDQLDQAKKLYTEFLDFAKTSRSIPFEKAGVVMEAMLEAVAAKSESLDAEFVWVYHQSYGIVRESIPALLRSFKISLARGQENSLRLAAKELTRTKNRRAAVVLNSVMNCLVSGTAFDRDELKQVVTEDELDAVVSFSIELSQ